MRYLILFLFSLAACATPLELADSPLATCHDDAASVCIPRDMQDKVVERLQQMQRELNEYGEINRDLRLRLARGDLCA